MPTTAATPSASRAQPLAGPPLIGLTGSLGAGKTTALAALARMGAAVVSADDIVHDLYARDDVRAALVAHWGTDTAATPTGAVDRAAIAQRAFASNADRAWLEELLWPLVGAELARFAQAARAAHPPPAAIVAEIPLLFEAGMESLFDATIAVLASDELRDARIRSRKHVGVEARGARQLSQQDKARRATHVVHNDGTPEQLERQLAAILRRIREAQRARP